MQKGFTIIELLVVATIIAVLAAIVTASVVSNITKAKTAKVKSDFQEFSKLWVAVQGHTGQRTDDFIADNPAFNGSCLGRDLKNVPESDTCYARWVSTLALLQDNSNGVTGILGSMNRDPWGSPYVWATASGGCYYGFLASPGPDGITNPLNNPGVADDIRIDYTPPDCGGPGPWPPQ